jgi:exosortase/archaeosortase family protein
MVDKRFLAFAGFTLVALALVFEPLRDLMGSTSRSEFYSHIILIPLVTGYLFYTKKKELLGNPCPSYALGGSPIPFASLHPIIYALQVASTEVSDVLFGLSRVPYTRDGFVFHLPGISVEVAEVCSGIRSSLALFITAILAGHFFLDKLWKNAVLAVFIFPVTVFKNGIRIITLSLLGAYVDPKFLTGSFLHQSGGFIFFIPALVLLGLALFLLRKKS